jgi:hypothetical protein
LSAVDQFLFLKLARSPKNFCSKFFAMAKRTWFKPGTYYARNREKRLEQARRYRVALRSAQSLTPWKVMLSSARARAARKGIEFDLDDDWAEARWTGYCELTGIEFQPGTKFWAASLDRIDNSRGYVKDNCRFVLNAVNLFKGSATDEEMFAVAQALVSSAAPRAAA